MGPPMAQMTMSHQVSFLLVFYSLSTVINSCSPARPGEDSTVFDNSNDANEHRGMCFTHLQDEFKY
jgi:hypothetical protein